MSVYRRGDTFDGYVNKMHLQNLYTFGWKGSTEVNFLQKKTFIKVVFAFLDLINPECLPLTCTLCGLYPKWLGFDGVSLALKKDHVKWDTVDTIYSSGQTVSPGPTTLKHQERIFLKSKATRKLMLQFCSANPQPLAIDQFQTLVEMLQQECPPLAIIMSNLRDSEAKRTAPLQLTNFSFPSVWKQLLAVLASATSVFFVFRPAIIPLL